MKHYQSAQPRIRRALLSVSDKRGLPELAAGLRSMGVELLSTGGTARALCDAGVTVREISDYTGFPEIMDGRVKTLHPKVHGAILARRDQDDEVMATHGLEPIDLVVVNLYPFQETVARPGVTRAEAIENIDIGGPCMLRAAAKNHAWVTAVAQPEDYGRLLTAMREHGGVVPAALRMELAARAFAHSAAYDGAVADYLGSLDTDENRQRFGEHLHLGWRKRRDLRYGENPHQAAALYVPALGPAVGVGAARQLQGKPLSYNNFADADAALGCARAFDSCCACVIVKHSNPCGVALAATPEAAYRRAFATDPASAFGGVIAFNQAVDASAARAITDTQFAEVVIAPVISDQALEIFAGKKNLRVMALGACANEATAIQIKQIQGGLLVQDLDTQMLDPDAIRVASQRAPNDGEREDLLFAWRVARHVKSNAIVYARDGATIGIGAGQMSRVDSARIAARKAVDAELSLAGAVMASDAFFPFRDGIDTAAAEGIVAVIQPGGSIRDEEVIAAADQADMAMLFTGIRHFHH
ncbi:MAG: bifunctional phosphoribosylaminoimidazolecarboxamide formyltransferase/IMP cyclohydrolase [Salinisphaera sp.]|nr:bifunctional phosphoribosylaminoimidazolecarboxamide formyltransferase/IMP cyclohydrolase [Salinisphaera sp.]